MAFNRKITLQKITQGYGSAGQTVAAEKVVWADVKELGVTTKYAADAAGKHAEIAAVMWRKEFGDYSHAVIDTVRYKVESTGRAENDLHIKLILARG